MLQELCNDLRARRLMWFGHAERTVEVKSSRPPSGPQINCKSMKELTKLNMRIERAQIEICGGPS